MNMKKSMVNRNRPASTRTAMNLHYARRQRSETFCENLRICSDFVTNFDSQFAQSEKITADSNQPTTQATINSIAEAIQFNSSHETAHDSGLNGFYGYLISSEDTESWRKYVLDSSTFLNPRFTWSPIYHAGKRFAALDFFESNLAKTQNLTREDSASCLRALAFVNRAIKTNHSQWDSVVGEVMLMLSSLADSGSGQLKIDARRFGQQAITKLQSLLTDNNQPQVEDHRFLMSYSKALVAAQRLGMDLSGNQAFNTILSKAKEVILNEASRNNSDSSKSGNDQGINLESTHLYGDIACKNCSHHNEAQHSFCKYCGWVLQNKIPNYIEITDSLTACHIISELGESEFSCQEPANIKIKTARAFLQRYQKIYPLSSLDNLGLPIFKQQCLCITQLIMTLSNYGRHHLNKGDFPAEWTFLSSELVTAIQIEDVQLVGQIVFCLSIISANEPSPQLYSGRAFLRSVEAWFGNTGRWTDTDADLESHYRTSWFAAAALMDPSFQHSPPTLVAVWKSVFDSSQKDFEQKMRSYQNMHHPALLENKDAHMNVSLPLPPTMIGRVPSSVLAGSMEREINVPGTSVSLFPKLFKWCTCDEQQDLRLVTVLICSVVRGKDLQSSVRLERET